MNYKFRDKTYFAKPKDDDRDRIHLELGDSKVPDKFIPQMKIMRWDNEVNCSIRLIEDDVESAESPIIIAEDGKIKHIKGKREAHFYHIQNDEYPEGAAEFEILLKEKPVTNKIEFSLNTKGLKFNKQVSLKELYNIGFQEKYKDKNGKVVFRTVGFVSDTDIFDTEGKPWDHRDKDIIGSYAVYCAENKINFKDRKVYGKGKVGHIYFPSLIDANGWKIRAENLQIKTNENGKGKLIVTIPQDFLNNAVYPVRHAAGLTFGYTTAGNSRYILNNSYSYVTGDTFTGAAGTLVSMSVSAATLSGNANCQMAVYDNASPSNYVDNTGSVLINSATKSWWTSNVTVGATSSTVQYYLPLHLDTSAWVYYDSIATNQYKYVSGSFGTWASTITWTDSGDNANKEFSVYVTYTSGATYKVDLQSKGYIAATSSKNLLSKGYIASSVTTNQKDLESKASIKGINFRDLESKASVKAENYKDIESKGSIKNTILKDIESKASIHTTQPGKDLKSRANIIATNYKDLESKASIKITIQKYLQSKANIHATQPGMDLRSKADIKVTNQKDLKSKAAIKITVQKDLESKGYLRSISNKNLESKGSIHSDAVSYYGDVKSKANILAVLLKDLKSRASIKVTQPGKDLESKAAIKIENQKDIRSKAAIKVTSIKDLETKGNVRTINYKDLEVRANIHVTQPGIDLESKANIHATQSGKDLKSRANIHVTQSGKDLESKAAIKTTPQKDFETKASIKVENYNDLESKANIRVTQSGKDLRTKANIKITNIKDLRSKAAIKSESYKDLESKAAVKTTTYKDLGSSGFISTITINQKDLRSVGRIKVTGTKKDLRTKGFIAGQHSTNLSSKANIQVKEISKDLKSKAYLKVRYYQDLGSQGYLTGHGWKDMASMAFIAGIPVMKKTLQSKANIKPLFEHSRWSPSLEYEPFNIIGIGGR